MKIRLSRTFLLIIGGVIVLGGGSGAAAVFIGTDRILGPSYLELNGLECTTIETIQIKKDQRHWVRKYITTDEAGDGPARIRTALRVARTVQKKEKADLVQIAMVDKAARTDRAQMRGRVIGAQVIYIPDLTRGPEGIDSKQYAAYYLDGSPSANGEYYGMRIDLPLEDIDAINAKLTDEADCAEPMALNPPAGEHGEKGAHGKEKGEKGGHGKEKAEGHGEGASEHGKEEGHGEAPAAEGHDAPAGDGHGGEISSEDSGGFISSLTGMIFGKSEKVADVHAAPDAVHEDGTEAGHEVAAAGEAGHEHANPGVSHEETGSTANGGFLSSIKGMIFGSDDPAPAAKQAPAETGHNGPQDAGHASPAVTEPPVIHQDVSQSHDVQPSAHDAAAQPAAQPAPDAHGPEKPDAHADAAHADQPHPTEPGGKNQADAAGAAWLAKFRGQPAGATDPGKPSH